MITPPPQPVIQPAVYPLAARIAVCAGLLWSLFGAYLFAHQTFSDTAGLIAGGMSAEQASLYIGLPVWMDVAFGIGTIGGSLGSMLLLAGRKVAVPVLSASLVAYLALYAGDAIYGVFAAFGPPQVAVLTFVVAVAAGLLWLARWLNRQGALG